MTYSQDQITAAITHIINFFDSIAHDRLVLVQTTFETKLQDLFKAVQQTNEKSFEFSNKNMQSIELICWIKQHIAPFPDKFSVILMNTGDNIYPDANLALSHNSSNSQNYFPSGSPMSSPKKAKFLIGDTPTGSAPEWRQDSDSEENVFLMDEELEQRRKKPLNKYKQPS